MIYEPKGRALEYAPLACNLAVGCVHGCRYCYGPGAFRVPRQDWTVPLPKQDLIARFTKAAQKFAGDPREILFSFATDPFGTWEQVADLHAILPIAEDNRLKLTILTKNPMAAQEFLPIMRRNSWRLGVSLCWHSELSMREWEPGAPSIASRLAGLDLARRAGVQTWVSVEPVIDPREALLAIETVRDIVDEVKVGAWNHDVRAKGINWRSFLALARAALRDRPHMFKRDLLELAGEEPPL